MRRTNTSGCVAGRLAGCPLPLPRVGDRLAAPQMGAYHTIDLELKQKFTLRKPCWDAMYLERLHMATDVGARVRGGRYECGEQGGGMFTLASW